MRNYHNIESRKPLSNSHIFPYIGYAASGTKYYATPPRVNNGMWRWAPSLAIVEGEPPYFYTRTLAEASDMLAGIGGKGE